MADTSANKGAKITLHWLTQSRAHRILWFLEELNLSYDLQIYKRGKDKLAPKELRDIHPLGKSPVLQIQGAESSTPITLAESALIVEYISDHFGPSFIPERYAAGKEGQPGAETEEWLRYRYFMHYAEGSIMTPLVLQLVMNELKGPTVPFLARPITKIVASQVEAQFLSPEMKKQFAFLESQLASSGGDWFCGSKLTGADILMIFPLEGAQSAGIITREKHPKLTEYVERIHGREAYKKAVRVVEERTGEKYSIVPE